ncbi:MAG: hypothetical protein U0235_08945 [Polyangiaceae bacterium]
MASSLGCGSLFGIGDLPGLVSRPDGGEAGTPQADAGTWCETKNQRPSWFCDDFDAVESAGEGWDGPSKSFRDTAGGGTVAFDEERFTSGPRALRLTAPVLLSGKQALAHLQKTLPDDARIIRFEADARIETEGFPDDVGVYTMIQLAFAPSGGITISRGEKGTYLDVMDLNVANGQTSKLSTQSVRVGKWVELTLYVTLPTSASEEGYAELLVDGISGARLPITFAATKGRPIALGLGMVAQGPTNDVELAFDNVRIEIQK